MAFLKRAWFLVVAALALAGCATTGAPSAPQGASVTAAKDPLAVWLAQAPKPEAVMCSVDRATAPEAVARFDALSAEIAALYHRVYDDARTVSAAAPTCSTEELGRLQATLREVEAQRRALTAYAETLRSDHAISNITSQLRQTALLVRVGDDSMKLDRQLRATEEGAHLVLRYRTSAIAGK